MNNSLLQLLVPKFINRFIANRYLYSSTKTTNKILFTSLFGLFFIILLILFFIWNSHNMILGGVIIGTFLFFCTLSLSLISSIFNIIAVIGISLGVASLLVVVSLITGYYYEIQEKFIGFQSHITVEETRNQNLEFNAIIPTILKQQHVLAAAPTLYSQVFLSKAGFPATAVFIKGIDVNQAPKVLNLNNWLVSNQGETPSIQLLDQNVSTNTSALSLPPAFIGEGIAKKLKIQKGDIISLKGNPLSFEQTSQKNFYVAAFLRSGFEEYDQRFICISLKEALNLSSIGSIKKAVEIRIDDINQVEKIAKSLEISLYNFQLSFSIWKDKNPGLFQILEMQKTILAIIMFLIVLVASFNMIASLTMIVIDKTREIAILKAMGLTSIGTLSIFQIIGRNLSFLGIGIGIFTGWLTSLVIQQISYSLPSEIYKIGTLSIKISFVDVLAITTITILICLIATLYPASKAAKLDPIEGLRYE